MRPNSPLNGPMTDLAQTELASEAPPDDPGHIGLSIAGTLQTLGAGDLAALRRLTDERPAPAYWRFAARHPRLLRDEATWRPIVRALAILTPKGPPSERPTLHAAGRRLGEAFCDGGHADWPATQPPRPMLSELRLAQLLAARGPLRAVLLTRAIRALATRRDPKRGLDVPDLVFAFLRTDPSPLAAPYYRRLDPAERAARKDD